jgi:hypothetical protein
MDYWVSEETFQSLDDSTQKQILKDTEAHENGETEESSEEPAKKKTTEEGVEELNKKSFMDEEERNEKINETKDFDDAHKKSMTLILGFGKVKGKGKEKKEEETTDE